jgi:aminoglycoside 2'-N-acetyltransferase I
VTATVRRLETHQISAHDIETLRALFDAAWREGDGEWCEQDWEHAKGGIHVIAEEDGQIVSHGAVVERQLEVDGTPIRTGYVEAVATWPQQQRRGHATLVMRELNAAIRESYPLGALSTPVPSFYERLGWELWRGPTAVRTATGVERTPDDDDGIMILRTSTSPPLDLDALIICEWRDGDVW